MKDLNTSELEMVGGGIRIVVHGLIWEGIKYVASKVDVSDIGDPMDTKLGINDGN